MQTRRCTSVAIRKEHNTTKVALGEVTSLTEIDHAAPLLNFEKMHMITRRMKTDSIGYWWWYPQDRTSPQILKTWVSQ